MSEPGLSSRPWAAAASVVGFAMLVVYVTLILAEGGNQLWEILPWALLMAIAPGAALASALTRDPRIARRMMIFAAVLFFVIGFAGLFTIGIGFLLAAVLAVVAASRPTTESRQRVPEG